MTRTRLTLVAALLAGTALGGFGVVSHAQTPLPTTTQPTTIQPTGIAHPLPDFADLVAEVRPAVVSITVSQEGSQREARGTGFLVDANGTIVTNNHVASAGDRYSVKFDDGSEMSAKLVGRDPRTDLAVLKVSAPHALPALKLGNSDNVRPGEWVVAVGNPFGLGNTVTAGIVSALGRDIGQGPYDQFLQVDAAINQGNSGGPLFTQDGKVVGVNTAILSPTGGSVGIGFAIPSSLVQNIVGQLVADGHVTRGYMGVESQRLTPEIASGLGIGSDVHGALIASVQPDSPAAKAGLHEGDVIQAVGNRKVADPGELARTVADLKPGADTTLDVVRNGHDTPIKVTLASLPDDHTAANDAAPSDKQIGVALAPLTQDARDALNLPEGAKGAVIAGVKPNSPAQTAGLREGDLLVGVGPKSVASAEDAVTALRTARRDGKAVALRVIRNGQSHFVAIPGTGETNG